MTNLHSLQVGICSWMDNELLQKCSGLNKWMMGVAIMQAPVLVEKMFGQYRDLLIGMDLITEDDRINLDKAEQVLSDVAKRYGKVQQKIAGVNVTLGPEDVSTLASYIRNS